jgi:hypothetical protein
MSEETKRDPAASRPTGTKPSKKKNKKAPAKRKAVVPARADDEPVVSGRMVVALALALAMSVIPVSGLGRHITKSAPKTAERATWTVGQKASVHITVITSDYHQLACADERELSGYHCEFKNERERWPQAETGAAVDDNKSTVLQPYRTTDRNLMLLAGLWAQPEVATRLHTEPPSATKKDKLARFVVACEVKFLKEWENPQIRWETGERWSTQGMAMVAELESCEILESGER